MEQYFAHSKGSNTEEWQGLEEHLAHVAERAATFAEPFGGEQWAYLAGLWHDLGKFSDAFQKKLYDANGIESHIETRAGRVIHSEAGGHLATLKGWKGADRLLSWLIMGHHAGLADYESDKTFGAALEPKMREPEMSHNILEHVPDFISNQKMPTQRLPEGADPAFYIRMLFSCVVDADYLDTEVFMTPKKGDLRSEYPDIGQLRPRFDRFIAKKCKNSSETHVNSARKAILEHCLRAAAHKPSIFSLTVPTGGGKTLSSLAFALKHAELNHKSRIIYVIPYTSIIEQTAAVFRSIPGFENAVLEHHSNTVQDEESLENHRSRLAAENWDAPIIVTTSVQFFESLYAAKTSRCRKLHNIVNSVIIFDEAQCLPPDFLRPCTFAIRELFRYYGVTPLLCTATQPVLTQTEKFDFSFKEGFEDIHEIIPNPVSLANELKRVEIGLFDNFPSKTSLEGVRNALLDEKTSVLCILNRKNDARSLTKALPDEKTIHLSTNMCAKHRFSVLEDIKSRLGPDKSPLYVISTSLVEAGVDLDFPVVYRALAGLDSIAQAAGRCNREGTLEIGKTIVFMPENQPNYVKQPAQIALEALLEDLSAVFSPTTIENYFRNRFWQLGADALDKYNILTLLSGRMNYYFRTAASEFRLIRDDWCLPVIAPYGEAQQLIDTMLDSPFMPPRYFLRQLQPYTINIPRLIHQHLQTTDGIHPVEDFPGLFTLNSVYYDAEFGFIPPDEVGDVDPSVAII